MLKYIEPESLKFDIRIKIKIKKCSQLNNFHKEKIMSLVLLNAACADS